MALLSVPVIVGTGAYAVMRMIAPTLLKKLTQQGVKNIRKVPKTKLSSVPKSTPRLTTKDAKKLVDGKPITKSPKKLLNKKPTSTKTKRPVIKVSSGPSNRKTTTSDKAIMGTIGTLGASAAVGAIAEKLSKEEKKLPPGAFGGKISKGPKRVNTVRPYKSPIKSNKKMKDELARQEKIKNDKKNKLSNRKSTNVKNPAQEKRLSKLASEHIAATNKILRTNFGEDKDGFSVLQISANSQDASIMMNEGNYVAPRDEDGYNFFNSMKANTGFIPMRPETRMCTWEDRSVIEAFVEEHGDVISWNTLNNDYDQYTPPDFTFTQTTKEGAKWDSNRGGFMIHDVKAFAEAGGISQLIKAGYSEDVLKLFGIPTFTNIIKGK